MKGTLRSVAVVVATWSILLVVRQAEAQNLCFAPPTSVPGLSGPPNWGTGSGPVRKDPNEPRWAAGPLTQFKSDDLVDGAVPVTDAFYRVMANADGSKLYVQFQAHYDHGGITAGDQVFLGFAPTAATTAKGIKFSLPAPTATSSNPVTPSSTASEGYTFASGRWTAALGQPTWVESIGVWTTNDPSGDPIDPKAEMIDWVVSMVIDVSQTGIPNTTTNFKMMLGTALTESGGGTQHPIFTPTPPTAFIGNDPFANDGSNVALWAPTGWRDANATANGCVSGVTLDSSQIAINGGNTIEREVGDVNTFTVTPTYNSAPVIPGSLTAEIRIAMWGSNGDPDAPWIPLTTAATPGIPHQIAQDGLGHFSYECPPATGSVLPCNFGTALPAGSGGTEHRHQCVQARLNFTGGYDSTSVPITNATAYRNMNFEPLSKSESIAVINTKGLETKGERNELYLFVYPVNLPDHGIEQLYLPTDEMRKTFVDFVQPDRTGKKRFAKSKREAQAIVGEELKRQVSEARKKETVDVKKDEKNHVPRIDPQSIPSLVTEEQALRDVWPHIEVRPYYSTGRKASADGQERVVLKAMYPFQAFYSHDGPFFGTSYSIDMVSGGAWTEIRKPNAKEPGIYKLTVPKEGLAEVKLTVEAHEKPKKPLVGSESCKPCKDREGSDGEKHVKHKPMCATEAPGAPGSAPWLYLVSLLGVGVYVVRRRRAA